MTCKRSFVCPTTSSVSAGKTVGAKRITVTITPLSVVYLCKVDIADGFYHLHLAPGNIPALGVAFPPAPDGTPLIAFPLTCPMGWVKSPPWFSAATETGADLANTWLATHSFLQLTDLMNPRPLPPLHQNLKPPLGLLRGPHSLHLCCPCPLQIPAFSCGDPDVNLSSMLTSMLMTI
jgi:hypothetical protein